MKQQMLMPEMTTADIYFYAHVDITKTPNMIAYSVGFSMNFAYEQVTPITSRIIIPNRYFYVMEKPYFTIPGCEPYCQNDAGNYLPNAAFFSTTLNKHFVSFSAGVSPAVLTAGGNNQ